MIVSLLLIIAVTLGGAASTYLVVRERSLIWRLAAGNIGGSAIMGTAAFVLTNLLGLTLVSAAISLVVALLPLALLARKDVAAAVKHDIAKAEGQLQGGTKRLGGFLFFLFFLLLFALFFSQAMYETPQGIFTGGSQNLGDLPFHLGAIFSFTDGANFPPQNPSFAGSRFSYPFIADLLTAVFMRLGSDARNAMFVQNLAWAFSLLVLLEAFVVRLTASKLAGRIAPFLLFMSGGLGFVWFFKDFWEQGKGIVDFLWSLPRDYTIGDQFRWGNSLVVLFITQRSLLLGMPLTIVVLGWLWRTDATQSTEDGEKRISPLLIGLLAGLLPLIHLHSLFVIFVVTAFCLALRPERWRKFVTFGVGVCLIAIPELLWSMSGSATETARFFDWHFGWDKGETNVVWFWIKNTGAVIPLIFISFYIRHFAKGLNEAQKLKTKDLLFFYIPFAFLFVVSNSAKLAPWEWDNIKVLIYWFVGSLPLIAFGIAWMWERSNAFKVAAGVCFAVLIFAGSLDVFKTVTGQNKIKVFDADAERIAEMIKTKTPPHALFLNAPTYNSAVVLSGRRSFMRYSGHLASHGIDYLPREDDVKAIYQGGGVSDILIRKNAIEYILVSPVEVREMSANEAYFQKFPLVAESGQYRVYQVK